MNRDVEFERLQQENLLLRQVEAVKVEQMKLLRQENLLSSRESGKSGKNGMPREACDPAQAAPRCLVYGVLRGNDECDWSEPRRPVLAHFR